MPLEVIPAVLVKTRKELIERITKVMPYVKTVHIDVMDGEFVSNTTVQLSDLSLLPKNVGYEFHWMVKNPEQWIEKAPKNALHLVHVETINNWHAVKEAVGKVNGKIGIVLNPETPVEKVLQFIGEVKRFLIMAVHPGFDGQRYLPEVKIKMRKLKQMDTSIEIEVDGGITPTTARLAIGACATIVAAASAIFSKHDSKDIKAIIIALKGEEIK